LRYEAPNWSRKSLRQTGGFHVICNYECDEFRVAVLFVDYTFRGGGGLLPSQCCFHFTVQRLAVDLGDPVLAAENDENSKNSRRA
jgi:hypothetical protein